MSEQNIDNLKSLIIDQINEIRSKLNKLQDDVNSFAVPPPKIQTIFPVITDIGTKPSWLTDKITNTTPYPVFLDSDESYYINSEGIKVKPKRVEWFLNLNKSSYLINSINKSNARFGAFILTEKGDNTITLRVYNDKDEYEDSMIKFTVLERLGDVFYVSPNGNDINDGKSPATAWKTATKAFSNFKNYLTETTIIFEGGHTYELIVSSKLDSISQKILGNIHFTSSGSTKATIEMKQAGWALDLGWNGLYNISFSNLNLKGNGSTSFLSVYRNAYNISIFNCNYINVHQFFTVQASDVADRNDIKNIFVHEVNGGVKDESIEYNKINMDSGKFASTNISLYFKARNISQRNNVIQRSNNHILYGANIKYGVIEDCDYCYPAWGRHAIRISAAVEDGLNDFANGKTNPSGPIHIINNFIAGTIDKFENDSDVHKKDQYNFCLLDFKPNLAKQQHIKDIVFEKNIVRNCQKFMILGSATDVIIKDNTFSTDDLFYGYSRFTFGFVSFETRPMENIYFIGNKITSKELGRSGAGNPIFYLDAYKLYLENKNHKNVVIKNNIIEVDGKYIYIHYGPGPIKNDHLADLNQYKTTTIKSYITDDNTIIVPLDYSTKTIYRFGYGFQSAPPAREMTLDAYRTFMQDVAIEDGRLNDSNTKIQVL